ncbi:MAG: DinB family protein, partial [Streptosporangiaceae bacterium]
MASTDLLIDAFGRVRGLVHQVVDGMTSDELALRVDAEANSIAWLVWHLTRIQDDHIADAAGTEQV